MLVYSNSFYIKDNGNGYSLHIRDAICSNCGKIIGRQEKYERMYKEFAFSNREKAEWGYCPYCASKLY